MRRCRQGSISLILRITRRPSAKCEEADADGGNRMWPAIVEVLRGGAGDAFREDAWCRLNGRVYG